MRVGSFCSGICAPEVAWSSFGWTPQWFSEIEPFACALEAERFPHVPNLGDMTKVDGAALAGTVDIVVAGTPCQAFSVAGKRESLGDDRGNLTLVFVELIHAINPRWLVWENVPGVLSTDDNAFGCFLAGLVGGSEPIVPRTSDGRWTDAGVVCGPRRAAAWRVLDAQYVAVAGASAVAQRRERVFVVSRDFGELGGLETASPERNADRVCGLLAEILFESDRLPRDSAPCREAGAGVAASLTRGADSGGAGGYAGRRREDDTNIVGCLNSGGNNGGFRTEPGEHLVVSHPLLGKSNSSHAEDLETFVTHALRADGFDASEDGTGRGTPLVPMGFNWQSGGDCRLQPLENLANTLQADQTQAIAFDLAQITSNVNRTRAEPGLPASTLNAAGQMHVAYQCQGSNVGEMGALRAGNGNETGGVPFIAFKESQSGTRLGDVHTTLDANKGSRRMEGVVQGMAVRRLTPTECERLQDFPVGWTAITYRGKPAADGPRYRALGNSMACNVMMWLGDRICRVREARASA